MKVSLNWLKEYVNVPVSVPELCERMVMAGFEVESVEDQAARMQNVVAGVVTAMARHPNADKLWVCQIDAGTPVQIVTGAQNVFVGAHVPVALHDSLLPTGQHIKEGKLRGELSQGMLCSGEELQTDYPGAGVDGILILPESIPAGRDMRTVLGQNDCIIDFKITPNRPDCLSMLGVAREVAAVLGTGFRQPVPAFAETAETTSGFAGVTVEEPSLCPRYMARGVTKVKIGPSPEWLQTHLRAAGVRSINNIVDITNFVMLETGQPMHAFDMRFVEGRQIRVRKAEQGETLTTLDGKTHALAPDMLVIADQKKAIGLAGIMGGQNSEVLDDTTDILFESAKFRRDNVRRTARALGIRTESSTRFEKGVDVGGVQWALERAVSLVHQLACGQVLAGAIDSASPPQPRKLTASVARINGLLGIQVPGEEMARILCSLHIPTTLEGDTLTCQIPSFREDILETADLAEEVIRLYGYDKIAATPLRGSIRRGLETAEGATLRALKNYLAALGLWEGVTYSFFGEKAFGQLALPEGDPRRQAIRLKNPLGEEYAYLRTTLGWHMLTSLAVNQPRTPKARLFEAGTVYLPKALPLTELPTEEPVLCLGIYGEEDFFTLKALVEGVLALFGTAGQYAPAEEPFLHPGRQAAVSVGKVNIGYLGEVSPAVAREFALEQRAYLCELRLAPLFRLKRKPILFTPLPKYPAVTRDMALVVEDTLPAGELLTVLRRAGAPLLESAEVFDVYRGSQLGEGKKSIAVSLAFRSAEKTLTDEEVNTRFSAMLAEAAKRCGASLRA